MERICSVEFHKSVVIHSAPSRTRMRRMERNQSVEFHKSVVIHSTPSRTRMCGMGRIDPLNSTNPLLFTLLHRERGCAEWNGFDPLNSTNPLLFTDQRIPSGHLHPPQVRCKRIRGHPSANPLHHPLIAFRHPTLAKLFEDVVASEGLVDEVCHVYSIVFEIIYSRG